MNVELRFIGRADRSVSISHGLYVVYALAHGFKEEEVVRFYTDLQDTIDKINDVNERIIIMGDWNARIENDQNKKY